MWTSSQSSVFFRRPMILIQAVIQDSIITLHTSWQHMLSSWSQPEPELSLFYMTSQKNLFWRRSQSLMEFSTLVVEVIISNQAKLCLTRSWNTMMLVNSTQLGVLALALKDLRISLPVILTIFLINMEFIMRAFLSSSKERLRTQKCSVNLRSLSFQNSKQETTLTTPINSPSTHKNLRLMKTWKISGHTLPPLKMATEENLYLLWKPRTIHS